MLSSSSTIIDIKTKLSNNYSFFGYTLENEFDEELESICEDVVRLYFYPKIGETNYDEIADKDKVSLSTYETNLYWAEIYTVCVEFLKRKSAINNQLQSSANETLTVEGYTHKISDSDSGSLNDFSVRNYYEMMYTYWKLAGFNLSALERTCTIFGDSSVYEDEVNIIE
ncbi:MAG: hypothetical protein ACFFG0_02580 [Candidatus Thorarchaeota archaeon]